MYAIVRSGGHQHKVAVGDTLSVDRVHAAPGESVTLPAVLVVDDGGAVTTDAAGRGPAERVSRPRQGRSRRRARRRPARSLRCHPWTLGSSPNRR